MSDTSTRLFRHSAWTSQRVYDAVQTLPDEALDAYIVKPEWDARRILRHIVTGASWYVHCLTGAPDVPLELPKTMSDLTFLKQKLAEFDQVIASQAVLPDEMLTITEDEKSWKNLRSTILGEAILHAIEHRTQLIDALESRGYSPISLDALDLWTFESYERKHTL